MTVQSQVSRADYRGNNVSTLFTIPFYFLDNSHLKVLRTDNATVPPTVAALVLNSDYVVTGAGIASGGQVQTTIAPTATQVLTVLRNVPFTQLIHYVPNDPFPAATHEQALDQLTMEVQELNEVTTHALQFPSYEPTPPTLAPASIRASMLLGFDPLGNVALQPLSASIGAGDLRYDTFTSGPGFTPGTTTALSLSRPYGTSANLSVFFDGVFQGPDQYSLNGTALTFISPIPVGVQNVYVHGGTTLSLYVPPDGSVGDTQLSWGSVLTRAVASVSALQNLDVTKYQRASTNAYYAGGQGAADYFYDPAYPQTSANGGSAIASLVGTGCWRIVPRGTMNLFQWGAKGDGSTDDTAAIQSAITWAVAVGAYLHAPSLTAPNCFRCTAPLVVAGALRLYGDGCSQMTVTNASTVNGRGAGSWFYFNHAGRGFTCNAGGTQLVPVSFEGIGTIRDQPTPNGVAAFTPAANDFDFYLYNCDARLKNFVTWNATKGVYVTANSASSQSRTDIDGWRGQPLQIGLDVAFSADVVRFTNIHFWPFWSFAQGVTNYMLANGIVYHSGRNDNPVTRDVFAFGYAFGVLLYNTADGGTHKMQASNIDFDYVGTASLYVGAGVNGFFAQISNWVMQGYDATKAGGGIIFDDASFGNEIYLSGYDAGQLSGSGVYLGGTSNNVLHLSNSRIDNWNGGTGGSNPAISVQPNNFLYYEPANCEFVAPLNGGLPLSSTGIIRAFCGWATFSGTTDGSGQITVTHNLGHAPQGIATPNNAAAALTVQYVSSNPTSITFKVFTASTGAALASSAIAFNYVLFF